MLFIQYNKTIKLLCYNPPSTVVVFKNHCRPDQKTDWISNVPALLLKAQTILDLPPKQERHRKPHYSLAEVEGLRFWPREKRLLLTISFAPGVTGTLSHCRR